MTATRIFIVLVSSLLFANCEREAFGGRRTFSPEPFSKIELNDAFDVVLSEGDHYSLEITGAGRSIDDVEVSVAGDVLTIDNTRKLRWLTPRANTLTVSVTSPPLRSVTAAEGCDVQCLNPITSANFTLIMKGKSSEATLELAGHTFYYWNDFPNGGRITLAGEIQVLNVWNHALMTLDARDLVAHRALIVNESKGDCEVTVLDTLRYSIGGTGNINLYGDPAQVIEQELSSSGRLVRH